VDTPSQFSHIWLIRRLGLNDSVHDQWPHHTNFRRRHWVAAHGEGP